jgi:transposase
MAASRAAHRPGLSLLSSELVRDRDPELAVFCKAWRVRNTGGRFAKDQFSIDFAAGQLTCPAGTVMPFEPGKTVRFPKDTCTACPLRQRCTTSKNGRCRVPKRSIDD